MAMNDVLAAAAKKAKEAKDKVTAVGAPLTSEQEALREKQQDVNEVTQPVTQPEEKPVESPDKINPKARYGDKPGEQRIDTNLMTQPLGAKTYDAGGSVDSSVEASVEQPGKSSIWNTAKTGMSRIASAPMPTDEAEMKRKANAAGIMSGPDAGDVTKGLPVMDDGGQADLRMKPLSGNAPNVNDGKHQMAVLEEGERVLTPQQNAEYMKDQHGFGRIPTPPATHVTINLPSAMQDQQNMQMKPLGGKQSEPKEATESSQATAVPASVETPQAKISQGMEKNPPKMPGISIPEGLQPDKEMSQDEQDNINQVTRQSMQNQQQLMSQPSPVYDEGGEVGDSSASTDITPAPDVNALEQPAVMQPLSPEQHIDKAYTQSRRDAINDHMVKAAAKDDIVELGKGAIAHNQLDKHELRMNTLGATGDQGAPTATAAADSMAPAKPGLPVIPPVGGTPATVNPVNPRDAYAQRETELKAKITDPKATAVESAQAEEQLAQLRQNRPWNSRSFGSKLGHIAEAFLPTDIRANIPGSADYQTMQRQGAEKNLASAEENALKAATANAKDNPATKPEEQIKAGELKSRNRLGELQQLKNTNLTPEQKTALDNEEKTIFAQYPALEHPAEKTAEGAQEQFLGIAQKAPDARSQEEQNFFSAHVGDFGGKLPVDKKYMDTSNQSMQQAYTDAQTSLGTNAPKPQAITPQDNADKAEKKMADYSDLLYKARDAKAKELAAQGTADLNNEIKLEKLKTARAVQATDADVAYSNLYSQTNYKNAMDDWYKSGNYAKDSGLITGIVDDIKAGHMNLGPVGGATLGALMGGTAGAAAGGAAAAIADVFGKVAGPTIDGYMSTLVKNGISKPGYNAMQAYFNSIPARLSYETKVVGVQGTAMRLQKVVTAIINTVPAPNTPQEDFDKAYDTYYKAMEHNVKNKVQRTAPEGYVPPKFEDYFEPKAGTSTTGTAPGGRPPGW